jgi:hypothetical protein
MILHCLIWCLWRERNTRHFKDAECHIPELKYLFFFFFFFFFFFHTLFDWVIGSCISSIHSMLELIDLCKFLFFCPSWAFLINVLFKNK